MKSGKPLFAILISLLIFSQASGLPLFVRLLLEPGIIYIRYRAAGVLNEAGLGFGGILSKIGQAFNEIMTHFGKRIQNSLNRFALRFTSDDDLTDIQTPIYKKMMKYKKTYIKNGDFVYYQPSGRQLVGPLDKNDREIPSQIFN